MPESGPRLQIRAILLLYRFYFTYINANHYALYLDLKTYFYAGICFSPIIWNIQHMHFPVSAIFLYAVDS